MSPHPALDRLRALPGVEITGAVDDIVPYIHRAAIYLAPMRVGGGTRFKVLEAMACARPVVSTSLGVEGIPVRNGEHLLIADQPRDFADAVLSLLRDQAAGGQRSRALGKGRPRLCRTTILLGRDPAPARRLPRPAVVAVKLRSIGSEGESLSSVAGGKGVSVYHQPHIQLVG